MSIYQLLEQDIILSFGSFDNYYMWKIENYLEEDRLFKEIIDDIEADRIIDEYKNGNYDY